MPPSPTAAATRNRAGANIADGEDSRDACFKCVWLPIGIPASVLRGIAAREDEAVLSRVQPRWGASRSRHRRR